MSGSPDPLLARWCRRADAAALAELFDRDAPRLLQVAIHLAGDAAEAEDLVQSAFLALIESRERLDATRPALAWLTTVVANKARDLRRRRRRSGTLEQGALASVLDPARTSQARELSGELARALDRLREPYRQVLVLRLRHGLAPADIAHVLGQSPGAVRVRLARALEQLRALLPHSLALGLGLALASPRGLALVRTTVLAKAASSSAAVGTGTLVGAWIVQQKLLAAALALCACVTWLAWPKGPDLTLPQVALPRDVPPVASDTEAMLEAPDSAPPLAQQTLAAAPAERSELATPRPSAAHELSGVVVDGPSGNPLAGARLELYAARHVASDTALAADPALYKLDSYGRLASRSGSNWPRIVPLSTAARFGRGLLELYDAPQQDAACLASVLSDAEGRFVLPAESEGGILRCSLAGYGTRCIAAWSTERDWRIGLWAEQRIHGRLRLKDGHAPGLPLELVAKAFGMPAQHGRASGDRRPYAHAPEDIDGQGLWRTTASAAGDFELMVAGSQIGFEVITPGWSLGPSAMRPPGDEPYELIVYPVPGVLLRESTGGAPIEEVRMVARGVAIENIVQAGRFLAPGGLLELPALGMRHTSAEDQSLDCTFWSDRHAARTVRIDPSTAEWPVIVELEAGGPASLEGLLHEAGRPRPGLEVALCAHHPLQWDLDVDAVVDAIAADERGHFRLSAAPGSYLLRVHDGDDVHVEPVRLPQSGPCEIDLAADGTLELRLSDPRGNPCVDHFVFLMRYDGFRADLHSDAGGVARFEHLPPGNYHLIVHRTAGEPRPGPVVEQDLVIDRGQQLELPLVLETEILPRHARVDTAASLAGSWRARTSQDPRWRDLPPNGLLPYDLNELYTPIEVEGGGGARWCFDLPKDAPDGTVVHLDAGEASFSGILRDEHGIPAPGRRIWCNPWRSQTPVIGTVSVLTDAQGRFEIHGLAPVAHLLNIMEPGVDKPFTFRMGDHAFLPDASAGDAPFLELRLPPAPETFTFTGTLRSEADGAPVPGHFLLVRCLWPCEGGRFLVRADNGRAQSDAEGRFSVELPRTPLREVDVYREWSKEGRVATSEIRDTGLPTEPPCEIVVP